MDWKERLALEAALKAELICIRNLLEEYGFGGDDICSIGISTDYISAFMPKRDDQGEALRDTKGHLKMVFDFSVFVGVDDGSENSDNDQDSE